MFDDRDWWNSIQPIDYENERRKMSAFTVIVTRTTRGSTEYGPDCITSEEVIRGPEVHLTERPSRLRDELLVEACRKDQTLESRDVKVYFQKFTTAENVRDY